MDENNLAAQTALEQYSVVEAVVRNLDLDSAVIVSKLSKLWHGSARRRIAESRVKHGLFLNKNFDEEVKSLSTVFSLSSVVILFSRKLNMRYMEEIEKAVSEKVDDPSQKPLIIGVRPYRSYPVEFGKEKFKGFSWISLPLGLPTSVFSDSEFFDMNESSAPLREVAMLLTNQQFSPPERPAKRRKLNDKIKGQIVGGMFDEIICNYPNKSKMKRVDFLAVCMSSIPQRISLEFGETCTKFFEGEKCPHRTCVIIFPCASVAGRKSCEFLNGVRNKFPRNIGIVGGFTGGEWFGRFTAQDFSEANALIERMRHAYSCFYIAFVCR